MCCGSSNNLERTSKIKKFIEDYASTRNIYKYINFGLMFVTSKNIKNFLLKLNIKPNGRSMISIIGIL